MTEKQWYTNKDLSEQINDLKMEMRETRIIIKRYNGLYEKVAKVVQDVEFIKANQDGKLKAQESIIKWGGWIFGLINILVLLINQFGGK